MSTLTFELKHHEAPGSLNAGGAGSRRHWAVGYREKRRWQDIYFVLLSEAKVPKGMEFCEVDAVIRWKRKTRRDVTNYVAPIVKPFADELVKGGWLSDDTDDFFRFGRLLFEYPSEWTGPHNAELILKITARYPEEPASKPERLSMAG